jgi:hypothetical protein
MLQPALARIWGRSALLGALAAAGFGSGGLSTPVGAQEVPDTTLITISGTIYDSRTFGPLPGATLRFSGTDFLATADEEGQFVLGGLVNGTYLLVVAAPGYQEMRVPLQVVRTGSLNIPLEPATATGPGGRTNRVIGQIREAETASKEKSFGENFSSRTSGLSTLSFGPSS